MSSKRNLPRLSAKVKKHLEVRDERLARVEQADLKFDPHEVKINLRLALEKRESAITLLHHLHFKDGFVTNDPTGTTEFPASLFKDEQSAERFAVLVNRVFTKTITSILAEELILTLNDVVHFALNELEIDPVDLRKQVNAHVRQTKRLLTKRMQVERKGKKPLWNSSELARAVLTALDTIPKGERTLAGCADLMKAKYGDRVPDNADGFRKLLERNSLSWRKLKNGRTF